MKKVAGILYKYPFLLFTLFLVIAYLPVFLPFFHIKNDLVTQNLPSRFVISESLYSGYFPWWNPFIHYGIPQYGNMNTGFWNPFLWLIASTTGYSIYSITYEEMFYLLIGTWGIYKLIKEFTNKEAAVLTGLAYCCSGYAIGHLQHFIWITGVAFFPYVLFFLLRTYKNPLLKNFIGAGISTFIFIASTHPGLVIGAIYFILFIIAFIFLFRKNVTQQLYSKHFWEITILLVISIVLSSIVVIISNLDILQHISRGSKVSLAESLLTPTTLQSYLSLLFPLPVHKTSFFNTDISMRNVYGGLLLLPGLLLFLMKQNWKIIISIAIPLGFFFLLAMGGIFKTFAWHYIPYTGYVRLNGEFTYFVLLILLLLAANGFNDMFENKKYSVFYKKAITKNFLFYSATAVVSIFILIFRSSFTSSGFSDQNFKEFVRSFF
ncbi:MAG: hypothetical protein JSU05_05070, partial [Bacteroidetes bacterium]|nr:hypothetical protein [Bacteroidota bacterium]